MPKGTFVDEETDPPACIVVHPDDRQPDSLQNVPGRSSGCCGLDGCDGPNQACTGCGEVVGTARTDCWTEKTLRFWPDHVTAT
jgi:hypothetical protein